jgi:hypothetical protein
LNNKVSIKII